MTAAPSSCTHASLAQGGSTAVAAAAAVVEQQQQAQQRRPTCAGCGRPLRVCYCAALPAQPLQLHGRVVILQHPHELKRTLATVPLLSRVLSPACLSVLVGRRLQPQTCPALSELLALVREQQVPLLVLFPGPGAEDVCQVAQRLQQAAAACPGSSSEPQQQQQEGAVSPAYVLLLVDGTWQQAKEMFDAAAAWLLSPEGPGQQVQLPKQQQQQQQQQVQQQQPQQHEDQQQQQHQQQPVKWEDTHQEGQRQGQQQQQADQQQQQGQRQGQQQDHPAGQALLQQAEEHADTAAASAAQAPLLLQRDSGARIRTEPAEGTCSTLEAVAAAVSILEAAVSEAQQQSAADLFDVLMRPLRLVTEQQAAFDPAVAARLQPGASGVVQSKRKMGMRRRLGS